MKKAIYAVLAVITVVGMTTSPATADPTYRDVGQLLANAANRYLPHEVGKPVDLSYVFGPYTIPPGQDSNRITVDLPVENGFVVAIAPDLVDARDGRIPTQQEAHIHHAHWFRITDDPEQEYYPGLDFGGRGGSWVFGTGEEKTQGRLDDRARLEPENNDTDPDNNFTYGIQTDATTPAAMIYMIHNKLASAATYFVVLDVTFIPGTRAQIKAATGTDVRPLYGQLWGQTKTVAHNSKKIGATWTAGRNATAVASGGHLHPGGKMTIVSNLGAKVDTGDADTIPDTPACLVGGGIDPDGDGFDGVAILNSYKFDRVMEAWPYTENYQMGATKYGWRAPIHAGDVLTQSATYALDAMPNPGLLDTGSRDVLDHHWYQAMTYTGIYMDRDAPPTTPAGVCSIEALGPKLLGEDTFEVQGLSSRMVDGNGARLPGVAEIEEDWNLFLTNDDPNTKYDNAIQGMVNHIWQGDPEPLCAQANLPELSGFPTCGPADIATTTGPLVDSIHVGGFLYAPGDLSVGAPPMIPQVKQGSVLTFVNEDAAANIRHTFTSCAWPCVGRYVSNFPLPDGGPNAFDSGKIGNIDPVDGGLNYEAIIEGRENDTVPYYKFNVNLPVGKYAYHCRIHPHMRGAFEVIS